MREHAARVLNVGTRQVHLDCREIGGNVDECERCRFVLALAEPPDTCNGASATRAQPRQIVCNPLLDTSTLEANCIDHAAR